MSRLALRIVVVLVTLTLVGEGIARLWITSPSGQDFDPELGWAWRPGATVLNKKEGGVPFVVSPEGLNDAPLAPKGQRLRVLGFGNSFMEALQVDRDDNYTSLVERARPDIDFLNLARSAMGPAHYPVVLQRYTHTEPDLLVVSLGEGDLVHLMGPTVAVRDGGVHLVLEQKDRIKDLFGPLITRSALATHLMRRMKPVVMNVLAMDMLDGPATPPATLDLEAADARLVEVLRHLRRSAPVLLLDVPQLRYLRGGETELGDPDESATYARAATLAGVDYLDAGPALRDAYAIGGQPGHGFDNLRIGTGHLNERGHAAVAAALTAWFAERWP